MSWISISIKVQLERTYPDCITQWEHVTDYTLKVNVLVTQWIMTVCVIHMGLHSLLDSKAISKCEVNPTSVFKLQRLKAISRIVYNVNLQTAVATILFFVEWPKSTLSEVLVVLRPYQNVKSIQQAVFKLPHSQTISCIGYNVNLQTVMAAILVFVTHNEKRACSCSWQRLNNTGTCNSYTVNNHDNDGLCFASLKRTAHFSPHEI